LGSEDTKSLSNLITPQLSLLRTLTYNPPKNQLLQVIVTEFSLDTGVFAQKSCKKLTN